MIECALVTLTLHCFFAIIAIPAQTRFRMQCVTDARKMLETVSTLMNRTLVLVMLHLCSGQLTFQKSFYRFSDRVIKIRQFFQVRFNVVVGISTFHHLFQKRILGKFHCCASLLSKLDKLLKHYMV